MGKITDARIPWLMDGSKEEIRLMQSMPDWIPGEINGERVKVRFTLPLHIRLD